MILLKTILLHPKRKPDSRHHSKFERCNERSYAVIRYLMKIQIGRHIENKVYIEPVFTYFHANNHIVKSWNVLFSELPGAYIVLYRLIIDAS